MISRKTFLLAGLIMAGSAVQGFSGPGPVADLQGFYQLNCIGCHGVDGSARDAKGKRLRGVDFTDSAWQASAKDERMVKVILKGVFFGFAMPSFKDELTPTEAQRLVTDVLRTSKKGVVIAPETKVSSPAK